MAVSPRWRADSRAFAAPLEVHDGYGGDGRGNGDAGGYRDSVAGRAAGATADRTGAEEGAGDHPRIERTVDRDRESGSGKGREKGAA